MQFKHNGLLLILLALIWGSSFWLIKQGLEAFTPLQLAAIRIISAALTLLPFALLVKTKAALPWKVLLAIGTIGNFIPAILFALAQSVIHSALAGMINALQPLFTLIIAYLAFNTRITALQLVGVVLGFFGTLLLLSDHSAELALADHVMFSSLVILATFCYGLATNLIKQYCQQLSPVTIASVSLSLVAIPSVILLSFELLRQPLQTQHWMLPLSAIVMLGVVGTALALILFNRLIHNTSALFASLVTYLIPIVATLWGILDDEPITGLQIVAMLIILVGLAITNWLAPRLTKTTDITDNELN
ncbi:MAG: EamA family transporter [Gammaproteobacteria bacterium]|nr:EamA family transporter [Gammaproteobacteria bacterium]NVK87328.1 EamA family transporter [Gammaproteobacteria bacterium]